jgi:LuxR family maltose regulon positive regulatory protein
LSYINSGIQNIRKEFGKNELELLKSPKESNSESITCLLINDILSTNQDLLLVLDDFHLISSSEILIIVDYLLEHIPENIHIVILSRSDPNLPIAKLSFPLKIFIRLRPKQKDGSPACC